MSLVLLQLHNILSRQIYRDFFFTLKKYKLPNFCKSVSADEVENTHIMDKHFAGAVTNWVLFTKCFTSKKLPGLNSNLIKTCDDQMLK